MTLNHDAHNCTAHSEHHDAQAGGSETARFNCKHTDQAGQDADTGNQDAYNPDIIFPAANNVEQDIASEFYPEIYLP